MKLFIYFFIIIFSSFFIGVAAYFTITEGYLRIGVESAKNKQQCEGVLPRNQHCEVIIKAIPVEE